MELLLAAERLDCDGLFIRLSNIIPRPIGLRVVIGEFGADCEISVINRDVVGPNETLFGDAARLVVKAGCCGGCC